MKQLFIILLSFALFTGNVKGQATDMLWGPDLKLKGTMNIIGEQNGGVFALRYYKSNVFLEKYDGEEMTKDFSYPLELKIEGSRKKNMSIEGTYFLNGNIVLLASYYDKHDDKNILKATIFTEGGDLVKDWEVIAAFHADSKKNTGDYIVSFSPDKKSVMVAANLPYEKKKNERYQIYMFNQNLEKQWQKEFVLPYADNQVSIYSYVVDNNRVAHMLASVAPATRKERKQARKAKEDADKQLLVTYDGANDKTSEYELKLKNKTIMAARLRLDSANNVIIAGFYHDNLNKKAALSGVFYARMQPGADELDVLNTNEFDKKFVAKLIGDKRAKKGKEISSAFVLRNLIPTKDGGLIAIAEEYYIVEHCSTNPKTGVQTCTYTYHFNDIIVTGINNQGEIIWSNVIKKTSYDGANGYYLSYGVQVTDSKVNLIFLDNKKNYNEYGERIDDSKLKGVNVRKSVATCASVGLDGAVEYSVLYDVRATKITMRPRISVQLNKNTMIAYGRGKKRSAVHLGRISF
ncbi:MAG: hypothetical protein GC180_03040 [Bacteroidetes bacterium]|nr:hypothetical protein [Bacteroidota bacterium]